MRSVGVIKNPAFSHSTSISYLESTILKINAMHCAFIRKVQCYLCFSTN